MNKKEVHFEYITAFPHTRTYTSPTDVSIARKETTYLTEYRRFSVIPKIGYMPKSNKLDIIHTFKISSVHSIMT